MRIWILAIATVAVLIGVAGGSYWYGGKGADESALVLNRAPAASDGIKVHGDWTLTVSNPDGSVDSVHEFENEFVPETGSAILMWALLGEAMLKGDSGVNMWRPSLWRNSTSPSSSSCKDSNEDDLYQVSTSIVMNGPKINNTEAFQVVRTCTIKEDLISRVSLTAFLSSHQAPSFEGTPQDIVYSDGSVGLYRTLTNKEFDNPIPVVPGQVVSTTVRVTFE